MNKIQHIQVITKPEQKHSLSWRQILAQVNRHIFWWFQSCRDCQSQPLPDLLFDMSVATLIKGTRKKKIMSCFILVH